MQGFFHGVRYAAWIIKEIFVAGFDAVAAAFNPRAQLEPIVIYYPLRVHTVSYTHLTLPTSDLV